MTDEEEKAPPTAIERVEEWLYSEEVDPPIGSIESVIAKARKADAHAALVYQVMGWMCAEIATRHNIPMDMDRLLREAQKQFDMPVVFVASKEATELEERSNIILPPGLVH
jgi:hypothetical protein